MENFLKLCEGEKDLTEDDLKNIPKDFATIKGYALLLAAAKAHNAKNFKFLFDHGCRKIETAMFSNFPSIIILKDILINIDMAKFAYIFNNCANSIIYSDKLIFEFIQLWHYFESSNRAATIACDYSEYVNEKRLNFTEYTRKIVSDALCIYRYDIVDTIINEFGILPDGRITHLKFTHHIGMGDTKILAVFVEKYLTKNLISNINFNEDDNVNLVPLSNITCQLIKLEVPEEYLFQKKLMPKKFAKEQLKIKISSSYDRKTCENIRTFDDNFFKDNLSIMAYIKNGYRPKDLSDNDVKEIIDMLIRKEDFANSLKTSFACGKGDEHKYYGNNLGTFNDSLKKFIKK